MDKRLLTNNIDTWKHSEKISLMDAQRPQPTVERQGLPGYWAVLFTRAAFLHSAESDIPTPLTFGTAGAALQAT